MNKKEERGVSILRDFSNGTLDPLEGCTLEVFVWEMDFPAQGFTRDDQLVGCTLRRGRAGEVLFSEPPPLEQLTFLKHRKLNGKIESLLCLARLQGAEVFVTKELKR